MHKRNRRRPPIIRFELGEIRVDVFEPIIDTDRLDVIINGEICRHNARRDAALAILLDHVALALQNGQPTPIIVSHLLLQKTIYSYSSDAADDTDSKN